ncbi:hypothetical protein ACLM5H_08065 [Fredinandcohnia humi]
MRKVKKVIFYTVLSYIAIMLALEFGIDESAQPASVTHIPKENHVKEERSNEEKAAEEGKSQDAVEVKEEKPKEEVIIATSAKGGFMDSTSYIKTMMEEVDKNLGELKYQLGNIRIVCTRYGGGAGEGKCMDPTYYFEEDPGTVEEAFNQLKNHIPTDTVVENDFQETERRYVYNVRSSLLKEKHSGFPISQDYEGEFHIVILKLPNQKINAAQVRIGFYKKQ